MKRPVTLILVASLLASGSVFARGITPEFKAEMATAIRNSQRGNDGNHRSPSPGRDRGNDQRDHGRPDNDHRNDHRGNDRNDNNRHDNDRHDNDRRDWNNGRNDHGGNNYRGYDHNGRDWNGHDRNGHDNDHRGPGNGWNRYRSDWNRHPNYWDNRRHDRADYARFRYHYGAYHAPRGYYYRSWHRGDHLPHGWYGGSYVVYNWAPYRLYSPPYGYHWVRVGNDVLLTAVATGIVLDVIYDIWY